jgi:hypothetical protein
LWNGQSEEFEFIHAVTVNTLPIQFLRQLHDAYGIKGAFLDANPTTCAQVFIDYRFLLSGNEFDRVPPVQNFGAEPVTRNAAIIRFAMLLVQRSHT